MYVVPLFSRVGVNEVDKASFSNGRKKELLQVADYLIHFLKHAFVLFLRKPLFSDTFEFYRTSHKYERRTYVIYIYFSKGKPNQSVSLLSQFCQFD